jgi:hypothetical protein
LKVFTAFYVLVGIGILVEIARRRGRGFIAARGELDAANSRAEAAPGSRDASWRPRRCVPRSRRRSCGERVGEHPGEWPRDTGEIERVDDQRPVLEFPVPEKTPELGLDCLLPMRGLLLISAERAQLALRLEQFLHRRRTQRAGQLILQVRVARIEAKPLEIGAREARAEAGSSESPPEVALFRGVVEAGETHTEPRGPYRSRKRPRFP